MDAVGLKVAGQTTVVACSFAVIDFGGVVAAPCRAVELAALNGGVAVHLAVRAPVAPAAAGIPSCAIGQEAGDTSGLEKEEEDSFVDIDGTPGTRCDQGGGTRGTGMVGKRVEMVTSVASNGISMM